MGNRYIQEKIPKGTKFNHWTVIKEIKGKFGRRFLCRNLEGIEKGVNLCHLKSGASKGYCRKGKYASGYKHGMSKTRIWVVWQGIIRRCTNPKEISYKHYGGRGIGFCEKWKTFEGFYEDMKEGYTDEMTIERIDNDGNYCKENCTWITKGEQSFNKQNTIIIEYEGKEYKLWELARMCGIKYGTLYSRLFTYKLPIERALRELK